MSMIRSFLLSHHDRVDVSHSDQVSAPKRGTLRPGILSVSADLFLLIVTQSGAVTGKLGRVGRLDRR